MQKTLQIYEHIQTKITDNIKKKVNQRSEKITKNIGKVIQNIRLIITQ